MRDDSDRAPAAAGACKRFWVSTVRLQRSIHVGLYFATLFKAHSRLIKVTIWNKAFNMKCIRTFSVLETARRR